MGGIYAGGCLGVFLNIDVWVRVCACVCMRARARACVYVYVYVGGPGAVFRHGFVHPGRVT